VLPKLAADSRNGEFDLALIDGCLANGDGGLFYINSLLKKRGFLMLDDVQLHSVAELHR
jgi:predicted O-methyltransferase YrrM